MKLIDMVEELVSQGHKITFRHRTDGGIIITSIDGKKFTSLTEGNKTARSMVEGGELSLAKAEQVKFNVNKYIKLRFKSLSLYSLVYTFYFTEKLLILHKT